MQPSAGQASRLVEQQRSCCVLLHVELHEEADEVRLLATAPLAAADVWLPGATSAPLLLAASAFLVHASRQRHDSDRRGFSRAGLAGY